MSEGFDPYYKWLGIGPEEQPANHYRLLGIRPFEPDPDVIDSASFQRMAHVRTYQIGPHSTLSQKILNELAAAKVCLLDPAKKAAYDSVLRSKIEAQASPRPPAEVYPDFTTPAPPRQFSPARQTKRRQQAWMVPAVVVVGVLCLALLAVLLRSGRKGEPQAEQRSVRHEQAIAKAEPTIDRPAPEPKVEPTPAAAVQRPPPNIPQPAPSRPEEPAPQTTSPPAPPSQQPAESPQQVEARLQAAIAAAETQDEFKAVAQDALTVVEKPVLANDQDFGKRLLVLALSAARKSGDDELTKKVTQVLVAGPQKPPQPTAPAAIPTTTSSSTHNRPAQPVGEPAAKQAPDIVAKPALASSPSPLIGPDGDWKLPPNAPTPAVAPFDSTKAKQHQEAWAKHLSQPVEVTNSIGMRLVLIPPGEFWMGSTSEEIAWATQEAKQHVDKWAPDQIESESPRHRVQISRGFYLGAFEVTEAEYQQVMNGDSGSPPPQTSRVASRDTSRHPMGRVLWKDGIRFCEILSAQAGERGAHRVYGLPTEAQWEYACRAGTTTRWSCGDDEMALGEYAWWRKKGGSMPVGQKKPNAWGLYDMHGSVAEWCLDWYGEDFYRQSSTVDPVGPPTGERRVLRGGSWWEPLAVRCRSAFRGNVEPGARHFTRGFRVACEMPPPSNR